MISFQYACGTQIQFGAGMVSQLPSLLKDTGFGPHVLLVTDPGLMSVGVPLDIASLLKRNGFEVTLFEDVQPNPRDTDCLTGANVYISNGCSGIVAVGGGSAMDTAKTIGLLALHQGTPQAYADGERAYGPLPPLACLPTTAGTGSEVTRSAVITEAATHRKMTLKHEWMRPKLAILDPLLTLTVPASVTAATGVDALVHAIEGYTCRKTQPISQAFGLQAMPLIFRALPTAYADGTNSQARSDMLLGSLLAGLCFGSADVAGVHCLAEALGGLYDTPHGIANAVFLLPVLRFNAAKYIDEHAAIARTLGLASDSSTNTSAVETLLSGLSEWLRTLEIPPLSKLANVNRADHGKIVELAMANSSTASNIRALSAGDYARILNEAFGA